MKLQGPALRRTELTPSVIRGGHDLYPINQQLDGGLLLREESGMDARQA